MGRNNADFKFAHEETAESLKSSTNKFDRKLENAIGQATRNTNGVRASVRVGSDWSKTGSPSVLRGRAERYHGNVVEKTAPMPTRKRDINKAVNKLHKKVAK